MKKKFVAGVLTCAIALGIGSASAGSWSPQHTMTIPGTNGSAYGVDQNISNKKKDDVSGTASFHSIARSTSWNGIDARVVNSEKESRSSWARNMDPGNKIYVSTTASQNYLYNVQLSSDITQIGSSTLSFRWSPDYVN